MRWKLELNGGKLTERDQKLLAFLLAAAILAVSGWVVIGPLSSQIASDRSEIELQEEVKVINDSKAATLSRERSTVENNRANYAEASSRFFPWMESDEIGRYLTNMALGYRLGALNMNIAMPQTPASVAPYTGSGGKEGAAAAPVLYTASVSMELQGSETVLQKMLDHLIKQESSMLVTGFTWKEAPAGTGSGSTQQKVLALQVDVYMIKE